MSKVYYFAIFFFSLFFLNAQISIIPQPQKITEKNGFFKLTPKTKLYFSQKPEESILLLIDQFRENTGLQLDQNKKSGLNRLNFLIKPKENLALGGYKLNISPEKIEVIAQNQLGWFHALQSIRQLLPLPIEKHDNQLKSWELPAVEILDFPQYTWRGFMLDVSRTFFDTNVVKKYLDLMAIYKMNTFHWHLTDDQGWRIEIKKYPELTSPKTTVFHHTENQPSMRSGFYTQDEIKEVVKYARDRNITIVPEIDIPGHSWPVLLVYPELGVNKNTYPNHIFPFVSSWGYWGNQFTPNTLDPTKEDVYAFLKNVFTELAELFPGKYIHFGGDEVKHEFWKKEAHVAEFMKKNNLKNVHELQSYFVTRVSDIIQGLGKKPIGWNDILENDAHLPKGTAIMSWLGAKAVKEATSKGFGAVATPYSHVYLDITQADRNDGTMSDLAYRHINSIDKIYEYNPAENLNPEERKLLLGVQGNFWSALAQDIKDLNVQVLPRLIAIAELGWTSTENKNFSSFQKRLEKEKKRLDLLKFDYYEPGGYIVNHWNPEMISEEYQYLSFDVTPKVYANGTAMAGFFFTQGENYLEIDGATLLENDKIISEDLHHALADTFRGTNKVKPFYFNFDIKNYNPKATYTVQAKVRSVGGTDSFGNFTFRLNPDTPFEVTEADK
ncbi:Beta-hexosaminidase [Candidatus Ornithobacterium hominis]|uniref:beta-N-acetylhexosaminidase n=1 Tax=Candidatus Ornithobacterium hominis TaxID=2497989 RepID=UPI000E5B07B0|nr:beta-N-acetylhexosaminidase [Candidatus Ornithobacterium hominis]SZD73738.1 Beta-hexosaminidase [Candidatus Ornithobacterium hominis]